MAHPQTTPADVHAILAAAHDKIDRLRTIACLIDLPMRESPVGARMGQTLDAEVLGGSADEFDDGVIEQMIRLMRRDLRAGRRIVYDERENLLELHARALAACATASIPAIMLSSADRQTSR